MLKKVFLILLFLLIAIISMFFIWRFINRSLNKNPNETFLLPDVGLTTVEITSLSAEKTEMTAKMLIKNQMPFSFTADSLQYSVFINDTEIMKSNYKESFTLKNKDSSSISLPIIIFNQQLKSVIKTNERENIDSVEYRLELSFYTNIIFRKKFDVKIKKWLPLYHLLEAKAEHIKIDSLNFSRAALQLLVSIKNQNKTPLKAKDINYQFSIEDNEWIKGAMPGTTEIQASGISNISVPLVLSFKEVSKTLFDIFKKRKEVNYKMLLTFRIESKNDMIKNSKVILENSGTLKSLMETAKE